MHRLEYRKNQTNTIKPLKNSENQQEQCYDGAGAVTSKGLSSIEKLKKARPLQLIWKHHDRTVKLSRQVANSKNIYIHMKVSVIE